MKLAYWQLDIGNRVVRILLYTGKIIYDYKGAGEIVYPGARADSRRPCAVAFVTTYNTPPPLDFLVIMDLPIRME